SAAVTFNKRSLRHENLNVLFQCFGPVAVIEEKLGGVQIIFFHVCRQFTDTLSQRRINGKEDALRDITRKFIDAASGQNQDFIGHFQLSMPPAVPVAIRDYQAVTGHNSSSEGSNLLRLSYTTGINSVTL